jgi:hypothetical protein
MTADHFGLHDNISDHFRLFSQLQFDYSHLQRKFSLLMMANFSVDLDSKFEFEYEYEYLTWTNLVHVNINNLLIPIIDRWPFNTIVPISLGDISQYIIRFRQVSSSFTTLHQIAADRTKLHDMNDHDENGIQFDLIENLLFQSSSKMKVDRFELNSLSYIRLWYWFWFCQSQFIHITSFEESPKINESSIDQSINLWINQSHNHTID